MQGMRSKRGTSLTHPVDATAELPQRVGGAERVRVDARLMGFQRGREGGRHGAGEGKKMSKIEYAKRRVNRVPVCKLLPYLAQLNTIGRVVLRRELPARLLEGACGMVVRKECSR